MTTTPLSDVPEESGQRHPQCAGGQYEHSTAEHVLSVSFLQGYRGKYSKYDPEDKKKYVIIQIIRKKCEQIIKRQMDSYISKYLIG